MVSSTVFLVCFIIASSSASDLSKNYDRNLVVRYPSEFYFRRERFDLVNSYFETSEVWYSEKENMSRIDFFNGTYKEYYVALSEHNMGYKYTIFPISTEVVKNKKIFLKEMYPNELPKFLPDIGGCLYSRYEVQRDGKVIRVYTNDIKLDANKRILLTFYAYRNDQDYDIPLKFVNKILNMKNGVILKYEITNYDQFNLTINADELKIDNEADLNEAFKEINQSDFNTQIKHLHPYNHIHVKIAFHSYKKHHNKTYEETEEELRKSIFHSNWRYVHAHNRKNSSYKMELNAFADRTEEELKALTGSRLSRLISADVPFPYTDQEIKKLAKKLPESYDLRTQDILGPVKSQGDCGACWAFAAVATVEAALAKANGGHYLVLSEQSLIDCTWGLNYNNQGCDGGNLDATYRYLQNHGVPLHSQYGDFIQKNGYCKLDNTTKTFKISNYTILPPGNSDALKLMIVKNGPVAVLVHSSKNMQFYSSGVFYDNKCEHEGHNHAMVVMGYGEGDGTPYWIVRNSWGETWGQNGYILMSAVNNNCFVLDFPALPIV